MRLNLRTCIVHLLFFIVSVQLVSAQKFTPRYLRVNDKSILTYTSEATEDGWLIFRADASIEASSFSTTFANSLGIGQDYQLRQLRDKTDVRETRHQHFQLYYKNLLVEGGHLDLHSRKGKLIMAHSRIIESLNLLVDQPISEVVALKEALLSRKLSLEDLKGVIPKGTLVITNLDKTFSAENYQLTYYFDVPGKGVSSEQNEDWLPSRIYVDAVNGKILKKVPLIYSCLDHKHDHIIPEEEKTTRSLTGTINSLPVGKGKFFQPASFNSLYPRSNPTSGFEVEPAPQGGYRLTMSTGVSQALQTRWDQNGNAPYYLQTNDVSPAFDDPDLLNSSLDWASNYQQATLSHWTTWRSYQYFRNRFGMNGTDGQGGIARVLISPNVQNNAFWATNSGVMIIGSHNGTILSSVDIVGHEYGHGVSNNLVAGWSRSNSETAALNEGFSDILGTAVERELYPTGDPSSIWNYRIGEDAWYIRNMANPHDFGDPWTYQESGFWDTNGEPHRNAGVLDKWFHTLTQGNGPNGNNITPISFDDAISIVYWGLDNYIYGDYGYYNTAQALRIAAGALYGQCSPQQVAVARAWAAGGIQMGTCTPDCNFQATSIVPNSVACNQAFTLSTSCGPRDNNNYNSYTCQNVTYSYSGPNVPYNGSTNNSINVTAPSSPGTYQYSITMSKPNSGCYALTTNFNVTVNCSNPGNCDFSNGPRYVGTWNGLVVQIRQLSGKNVLVTAIPNSSSDKYYPRGDNFWQNVNVDPGATSLQGCLNAGNTGYGGLGFPGDVYPPNGYYQGSEQDGAVFFAQNGTNPQNPCDVSPRHVGTWNGLNVEIRTFPNGKHALVTAVAGSSNDKYYPRGDNFWDNFTRDGGVDQYQSCLNAGQTGYYGLTFPSGVITPPAGYQQGTAQDGAVYFSTNGLRVAATEVLEEKVSLVKVYPNPAQEEVIVTVILDKADRVPIRLIDLQGKTLQQHTLQGISGKNERTLSIGSLTKGMYAIEVIIGNDRVIHKLIKE